MAESLIPQIGSLYRDHGVKPSVQGQRLISLSATGIMTVHETAQTFGHHDLPLEDTERSLRALLEMGTWW